MRGFALYTSAMLYIIFILFNLLPILCIKRLYVTALCVREKQILLGSREFSFLYCFPVCLSSLGKNTLLFP